MKSKICFRVVNLISIYACFAFLAMIQPFNSYAVSQSDSPVDPGAPGKVVKICASRGGFGKLDNDGKVYMYGNGNFSPPDDLPPVVDIAMGDFHAVALDKNGKVYSWGLIGEGGVNYGQTNFPADLPLIKAISASGYKTMMLTDDGRVLSFGDTNDGGQKYVPDMPKVMAIASSAYTSVALDVEGFVHAWGINFYPTVKTGPNVIDISTSYYDFVYLDADGKIYECSYMDHYKDIGDHSYKPFSSLSNIKKVTGSSGNYAAIDNSGNVTVWGFYMDTSSGTMVDVPEDLPPIQDIVFTANTAIALGEDGEVYQWGPYEYRWELGAVNLASGAAYNSDSTTPESNQVQDASAKYFIAVWLILVLILAAVVFIILIVRARAIRRRKNMNLKSGTIREQELDEVLNYIAENISNLRKLSEDEQDKLYAQVQEIIKITEQIVDHVRKNPTAAKDMRQFFGYTFPTTIDLLKKYYELKTQPIQGRNIAESIEKIEGMMEIVVDAFHRQLDALFSDEALSIDIEIDVMKKMLSRSGDITDIIL